MDAPLTCPCCGRPFDEMSARQLANLNLAPNGAVAPQILSILMRAWPRSVMTESLVEHVYASRPNGEPECAVRSVQVTIVRLRRRLQPFGWTIGDARHVGGYRLERLQ